MKRAKITHKIVLTANLTSRAPMLIANGEGAVADRILLRRKGLPYLPASSLGGVFRARWKEEKAGKSLISASEAFWGTEGDQLRRKKSSRQSHIRFFDMALLNAPSTKTMVRDGVRIDPETGTADDGGKFDYEILEPGAEFRFIAEVTVRESMDVKEMMRIVRWIRDAMADDLQVGANTTKGFGRIGVSGFECRKLDFPRDAEVWIAYCGNDKPNAVPYKAPVDLEEIDPVESDRPDAFVLEADFELCHSLMIGAPGTGEGDAEKAHLRSAGKPVISGRSLIGPMRARATRILKAAGLDEKQADNCIKDLFGHVDEASESASRSKLDTREADISAAARHGKQTRTRLDRFTAAPVHGGLFDSSPVWKVDEGKVSLWWRIRGYADWEAALLLHLLKDLWTEDLAVGGEKNVGRGLLRGRSAEIRTQEFRAKISASAGSRRQITITGKEHLDRFNRNLRTMIEENEKGKHQ